MHISSVGSTGTNAALMKTAPDGDSAAVEAAESRATKMAEKTNGGFAPKTTDAATKAFNAANGKGTNVDEVA